MGWSSSGDPLSNTLVDFGTKEEAIAFVEKNGWDYFVEEAAEKTPKAKSYAVSLMNTFGKSHRRTVQTANFEKNSFHLSLFLKKFREGSFFAKEVSKELIFFPVKEKFSFFPFLAKTS